MFNKVSKIWITGENFYPSKIIAIFGDIFVDFHDVNSLENAKLQSKQSYGLAVIKVPNNLDFEESVSDSDEKITWLLNFIEDKILIIKEYGGFEIQLDIEYTIDLENRQQRYIDSLLSLIHISEPTRPY